MSLKIFKFRVAWQEDDNIQRDIEIASSQTFEDLHNCIKQAFLLKPEWHAIIGVLNEQGKRIYTLDSKVEKNLKDAPSLSTKKTPIGALVSHPSQEFVYALENEKEWDFLINLITMDEAQTDVMLFPRVTRIEGISPMELSSNKYTTKEKGTDLEDKYDLEMKSGDDADDDGGGSGFTIEGDDGGGMDDFGGGSEDF
jgi:hypothetical protein